MLTKKLFAFSLIVLCFSLLFVGVARAQSPSPTATPYVIPTASPTPNSNETTPTPTPSPSNQTNNDNSTIIVDGKVFQQINPEGNPLTFSTFAPATITLNYYQAARYSINLTTAPDFEHNEFQCPYFMSASISGVGTYGFRFWVSYDQVINQTISLTVFTEDENTTALPQNLPLSVVNTGFYLDVLVSTSLAPHPATADEIALAQGDINRQLIENVTADNNLQRTLTAVIIGVIAVVLAVVVVLLSVFFKRLRKRDIEMMHEYSSGYGAPTR